MRIKLLRPSIDFAYDLEQISYSEWEATGLDPFFELSANESKAPYIELSLIISADKDRINSKVYLGNADARSEEKSISQSRPNLGMHSFIIDAHRYGRRFRLDPHNSIARLSIHCLNIREFSSNEEVKSSILARIVAESESIDHEYLRSLFRMTAEEAYNAYLMGPLKRAPKNISPYLLWQNYTEKSWTNAHKLRNLQESRKATKASLRPSAPFFSIVIPVYNPQPKDLSDCIDSILSQTYWSWELILVDDASTNESTADLLLKYASKDARIRVISRHQNGHISAATNDGIEASRGLFTCLVDNDDILSEFALQEINLALQESPHLKLIYSDEDFISSSGERLFPHFKTKWNPELLLSHNYITHFCCIETKFLKSLKMRLGYEGSQDYDLMLRISDKVTPSEIKHIPRILYHWRMSPTSTAASPSAKSYTIKSGLRALQDHLNRNHMNAKAVPTSIDNFYKLNWNILGLGPTDKPPLVSIIIPTRNSIHLIRACIESIQAQTDYKAYEIIIADNETDDRETLEYFEHLSKKSRNNLPPQVKVIKCPGPFNYSKINNLAIKSSNADVICLLNNDTTIINSEWLSEMVSHALRPDVGCVGAKLLYPDGTIQHAGIIVGLGGVAAHSHKGWNAMLPGYFNRLNIVQQVAAVTGACLAIKRALYIELGGLDERDFAVAFNDVDLCLKAWSRGYKNIFTPFARLFHYESKSRGYEDTPAKKERFEQEKNRLLLKWGNLLKSDPFYSPNLTIDREDYSIRVPPGHH